MKRRTARFMGIAIAGALLIASCGNDDGDSAPTTAPTTTTAGGGGDTATTAAPEPEVTECGVLVAGIPEDFDVIDPHIPGGESPATWLSLIYETLVGVDKNADVTEGLATDWTISDDGLTYTFTLREGVRFHNGEVLDSSHVKWNLERIINPDTGASSQSVIAVVQSIDTPDPQTVVLNLAAPNAPLLAALAQQQRVGIMHPDSLGADGTFARGIGTGPFAFDSYATGDRLRLVANADYWGGAPLLEGIDVRIIPDANTRLNSLATGDIDFAWALPAEAAFDLAEEGNFTLQENVQNRGNFFSININRPPFNDPKLREAMQLAVSRTDIAQAGWNGYAVETSQPFNENSFWYLDRELRVDADLETARRLVEEAGAQGAEVTITQWDQLGSDAEAQIVASAWTEIGLNVTIEKVSIADLISLSTEFEWDVLYLWIGLIQDPVRAYNFLWSSTGTRNAVAGGIQSQEMDDILKKALETSDPAERKSLYDQATQINVDQFAQFYTVRPFNYVGVSNDVTGFEMGAYYVQYQGGGMTSACVPA